MAQYVGCTIIDINPGAGLFSVKLHNFLRPRSHILLEPKLAHYQQFLKPLVEAPDSRYHIRDWPDEHRWGTTHFIREGLLPNADGVGGPPPTTDPPNNLALIVGNVVNWTLVVQGRSKALNCASLKALDFARAARQSTRISKAIPPRMLIWTADSEKHPMVPRTVDSRGRTSAILEGYCHVEEVVGSNKPRKHRREYALDIRSMQRVAERLEGSGTQKPPNSRARVCSDISQLSSTSREWHQELRQLEEGFKAERLAEFVGLPQGPLDQIPRRGQQLPKRTPEYTRMMTLRNVLKGQNSEIKKVETLLQNQDEIDRLDLEAANSEDIDEDTRKSKHEELDARITELKKALENLTHKEYHRFMFLDDDRRAFKMDPPLLMWDRRTAEPLIAHEEDFYYPKELALLDFQTSPTPSILPTTADQDMYFDMLASALISHKGPANAKLLDTVGPGAYRALVKHVPSLRDPRKAGRRDIDSVRARTMTPEMIRELAVAWDKWPFKPPLPDTLLQSDPMMEDLSRGGGPAARQSW